jgi:hypothetical protein
MESVKPAATTSDALPATTTVHTTTQQIVESTSQYGVAKVLRGNVGVKVTFKKVYQQSPAIFVTPISSGAGYEISDVTTIGFTLKIADAAKADTRFNWMAAELKDTGDDDGMQITAPTPAVTTSAANSTDTTTTSGSQTNQ